MRVVLIAPPGHFRDGLVALLRTVPELMGACLDRDEAVQTMPFKQAPDLVIVDGDLLAATVGSVREHWSLAKIFVLDDRFWMESEYDQSHVDGIFSKSLTAGEFLSNVVRCTGDRLAIEYQDVNLTAHAGVI